ncbi:MAG: hypothetical protein AAFU03_16790, partial [Bacteroidota bacterium]
YYSLNAGPFSPELNYTDLPAGEYTLVAALSVDGCGTTPNGINFTIASSDELTLLPTSSFDPLSCNDDNGFIQINFNPTDATDVEFTIDGGITWSETSTFSGLPNGNYIVGVRTSDSICVTIEEEAIELSSPDAPQIVSLTTSTTIGCAVDATGTITIEAIAVDGSALEYRLGENGEWSATTSYTNLGAGVYTIWVRKADGSCPVSQIVALNFDDVPAFSLAVAENSIIAGCDNQSGVIELIASGPQEALLYSLDGGATFQPEARFTGLPPGVYAPVALRLPMMGGDSCLTQGDLITILPAPVPAFEIEELNVPPNCSSNTGLLVFSVGIDSPNLQYSVDNGQSWQDTPVFEGLGTGAYMVAVRDIATGCTYLDLQQIAMNTSDATSINAIFVEQLSDCGTNDGSINVLTANNNPNETE